MHVLTPLSHSQFGLKYVDLYLIHGPSLIRDIESSWKEFEMIKDSGLAKYVFPVCLSIWHTNARLL